MLLASQVGRSARVTNQASDRRPGCHETPRAFSFCRGGDDTLRAAASPESDPAPVAVPLARAASARCNARVRFLRTPLLHFLVLGASLFAIQGLWSGDADAERQPPVIVNGEQLDQLREMARRELGREPTDRELGLRIDAWVDDELLVREARALGWHRTDPVVHMRLAQNLRFLGDDPDADDATLVSRAYALGMDRSDIVVRRRLIERMRLAITSAASAQEPDDARLAELLAREPERYRQPALVELFHVFLSRDRRGAQLEADAQRVLAQLRAQQVSPEAAAAHGDPSLLPAHLPLSSERTLAGRLGPDFAAAALELEPGGWRGPIASSYGLHLVWATRRVEARDPSVDEARRALLATWRAEREREALRRALDTLRGGVEVRVAAVEEPAR